MRSNTRTTLWFSMPERDLICPTTSYAKCSVPKTRQGMSCCICSHIAVCFSGYSDPQSMARHIDRAAGSVQFTGCAPNCTLCLFCFKFHAPGPWQVYDREDQSSRRNALTKSQLCACYMQQYVLGEGSCCTHERKKKSMSPAGMMYFWRPSWHRSRSLDEKPIESISFDFVLLRKITQWQTTSLSYLHILTWLVTSKFTGWVLNLLSLC